jgi:hypothetical protein
MRALRVAIAIVFATGLIWSVVAMLELVPLDGSDNDFGRDIAAR